MVLNRITYFDSLVKESQNLNVVFLNHAGSPASLMIDTNTIDLLADKKATREFFQFTSTHPLVRTITVQSYYKCKKLLISFKDGSEIRFLLFSRMVRFSLNCLPVVDILKDAEADPSGMMVPSVNHHFEYIMLKNQFNKTMFPDKFKKYFSALNQENRTKVFRYIQPRYNLVFNSLEDMYTPKGGVHLKITIALRKQKGNSFPRMIQRFINKSFFVLKNLFTNNKDYIQGTGSDTTTPTLSTAKTRAEKSAAF